MQRSRFWLGIFFLLFSASPVFAQEVGSTTQEVLENVSTQQKPFAVSVDEKDCKILGIFNCLQPKVDYTHENRLPETQQIEAKGSGFWESVGNFFSGLFNKSSDRNTGYGFTYLPQKVNPVGEIGEANVGGASLETDTEKTHETVKQAYLPYAIARTTTPGALNIKEGSPAVSTTPTEAEEAGQEGGSVPPAGGNNTASYANSLVETGGRACGWHNKYVNSKTKTLASNNVSPPAGMDAKQIKCINGKVNNEVYIDLSASANSNSWLQCVGFVIGVEQSQGRMLAVRNAKDYCTAPAPPGYSYINKNQAVAGDIAITIEPPWGHIMTITSTNKGSGTFTVAEANYYVSGGMGNSDVSVGEVACVLRHK